MLNRRGGPWEGGYISLGARGRKTYVIERRVDGVRFHISTRAHDKLSATRHLVRFESNPTAYRPMGDEHGGRLNISNELVLEYVDWQQRPRPEGKQNTAKHANAQGRYLFDWMEDLGDADWRCLSLMRQLKPALAKRTGGRALRIAAIKAFFKWLRREKGLVTSAQDATLDLAVPQSSPAKLRERQVVDHGVVQAVIAELPPGPDRDLLFVRAATGLHLTEIHRILRREHATLKQLSEEQARDTGVLAVVRFLHKKKRIVPRSIRSRKVLDALLRLETSGPVDRRANEAIKAACIKLELPVFKLKTMRHSWGTWHVERGATKAQVRDGYGHEDQRTTDDFYLDVAIPMDGLADFEFDSPALH